MIPVAPHTFRSGFAALIGRSNVGKSTLLNGLVGEKVAIVSPRPQTTRRRILGIRTTDAAQVIFVDTPGIHEPRQELGRYMVRVARQAIPDADAVLFVVDASVPPHDDDERIAALLRTSDQPIFLALNKSDLLRPEEIAAHVSQYRALVVARDYVLTIATEGHNLDLLWGLIVAAMPEGPALYPADQVTDQTERAVAAELIREAALQFLMDEIPHGIEVTIEEWSERANGVLYIGARLLVERDSHKGIVIGRGGAMLRRIGTAARREIELVEDRRVYLDLFVSVRPGWRSSPQELRRLGFE